MGNFCLTKFNPKSSQEKEALIKSKTIQIEDLKVKESQKGKSNESNENTENNLLENSSLKNIEESPSKSKRNDMTFKEKKFNKSMFSNSNPPVDYNLYKQEAKNYFSKKIFEEINNARNDFLGYSKLMEKYAEEIQTENKKNYLLGDDGIKIFFEFDKKDFLETAKDLKDLYEKRFKEKENILKKLEYSEEICFSFPKNNLDKIFDGNFITSKMEELKMKFKGKYNISKFTYFKVTKNPKISMVVEMLYDLRRKKKILLSDEVDLINIKLKELKDGMIGVFIVLARIL